MNKKKQHSGNTVRPPIVVVMGHVDHGKSTLLDYIRKENTVEGEAGGITQHVAAYEAEHTGQDEVVKRITFIDTPGHAAFKAIRSRGANIADIAILVVAADDGVKEQTLEALSSIKASGIPYLVAINKIDKTNANIDRTKTTLLENGVYLEGLGGDISWAPISAKTGEGVSDLLDLVLLTSDLEEFSGNPEAEAEGYVVEAHRDPKRGVAATVIIRNGTLVNGHTVLAGSALAPIRIMLDQTDSPLEEATFSTPVTIIGFDDLPDVGAPFTSYKTKKEAESTRSEYLALRKKANKSVTEHASGTAIIPIIVKADAAGSLEAVVSEIEKLTEKTVAISIIQSGIGDVSDGDVKAAVAAGGALIIGFNVETNSSALEIIHQHSIHVEIFSIIYELTERLESLIKEKRPVEKVEETIGKAKVLALFSNRKETQLLGGKVLEGEFKKGSLIKVTRRGDLYGTGEVTSVQSGKQNVDKVSADGEFGAQIESECLIEKGDVLECYVVHTK